MTRAKIERGRKVLYKGEEVTIYRDYLNYTEVLTKEGKTLKCLTFQLTEIEDDKGEFSDPI